MPSFHPQEELLLSYATGSLREPLALLVATHLALCPSCRREVERLEAVGGTLIDELEPVAIDDRTLADLLARLQDPAVDRPAVPRARSEAVEQRLPRPLRDYLADGLDGLPWKSMGAIKRAELLKGFPGFKTHMMRIKAGTAMPWHTHEGQELTLVLDGGFTDGERHYVAGDVATADPTVSHRPVADPGEDCLCLAVTDAPLRLTGPLGRHLNRFIRI